VITDWHSSSPAPVQERVCPPRHAGSVSSWSRVICATASFGERRGPRGEEHPRACQEGLPRSRQPRRAVSERWRVAPLPVGWSPHHQPVRCRDVGSGRRETSGAKRRLAPAAFSKIRRAACRRRAGRRPDPPALRGPTPPCCTSTVDRARPSEAVSPARRSRCRDRAALRGSAGNGAQVQVGGGLRDRPRLRRHEHLCEHSETEGEGQ